MTEASIPLSSAPTTTRQDAPAVEAGASGDATTPAQTWTVLCVDDEPNIVSALRRVFRHSGYRILTAGGGAEAIDVLEREAVDLIISDMRMPGMSGAQLLEQARLRWPAMGRVLLTGHADMQSTIDAINLGEIYRYIAKPWNDQDILSTARQIFERVGLERDKRRLEALTQAQNRELQTLNETLEAKVRERTEELRLAGVKLQKNYLNSIKVFSNLIELRGGNLAGHSRQVADLARRTARSMNLEDSLQQDIFVAGLLHDVGYIGLTDSVLKTPVPRLVDEELALYRRHPVLGEQALMSQEDMQGVAGLIRSHHERYDGKGFPDALVGAQASLGARILAVAEAYTDLQAGHLSHVRLTADEARAMIGRGRGVQFDPEVVDVFLQVTVLPPPVAEEVPVKLAVAELAPGMVLAADLLSRHGIMLLCADHVLTPQLIRLLKQREQLDRAAFTVTVKPFRRT